MIGKRMHAIHRREGVGRKTIAAGQLSAHVADYP
jgi:hypothetical protein